METETTKTQYAELEWQCPSCTASNVDISAWTAFPVCQNCGRDFAWYEINASPNGNMVDG
jgi:transposase-like protein